MEPIKNGINDPILASYLTEFSQEFDLSSLKESEIFERFSAYCVYFRDFSEYTELENVIVAGGNDTAIDSAAIFINDIFITSKSQVDEIYSRTRMDVDFAFIQSKTSKKLEVSEIGSFIQGIKEFFGERYMLANDDIVIRRNLCDYIFANSVKMKEKPKLHLFYCYTGRFQNDPNVVARVDAGKKELMDLNIFSSVDFSFLDSNALQGRYQEVNLRIEKEILISEYASLPPISGIRQSYLGVLRCRELVKLLSNSDGRLQKSIFNENVRDFLSSNPVNDEITRTIISSTNQSKLAALNNGITIVAKEIKIIGKKFTLTDFQIVNGCQTSHIIYNNKNKILEETAITVKMIEVEEKDIVNEIVRATNRQTEVKNEAFEVLGQFHKDLERFFASIEADDEHKLVYERRKRQYADTKFTAKNIVTLTFLTNTFVSCVLENPVDAVDYYGVLLKRYSGKIFIDSHSKWIYLASAKILKEVEKLCVGNVRRNIWNFRFILSLLVRKNHGPIPDLKNDQKQREYAERIIKTCHDKDRFLQILQQAERMIAHEMSLQPETFDRRNAHQDRRFIDRIISLS